MAVAGRTGNVSGTPSRAPSRARLGLALFAAALVALYATVYVAHCRLDTAPWSWDEAYFLDLPCRIAHGFHAGGLRGAWLGFRAAVYHKPPLSSFATLPAVLAFGAGSFSVRIDNLLAALACGVLAFVIARRCTGPVLAAGVATTILLAPFSLHVARTEFAEVWVELATLAFLAALLASRDLRSRRAVLAAGLAGGLGLGCKLSFPLLIAAPALVVGGRALVRGAGHRRAILANAALGAAVAALVAFLLLAHNWGHMRGHFRAQFGWVGQQFSSGSPLSLDTLQRYAATWRMWFGDVLLALLVIGIAGAIASRRVAAAGDVLLPLAAGGLLNLVYCYFHPVSDMRLTLGSFIELGLCGSIAAALLVAARPRLARICVIAVVAAGLLGLARSAHFGSTSCSILGTPPLVIPRPPMSAPDLREAVIDHHPPTPDGVMSFAFAGDHERLNLNNIELAALLRGIDARTTQVGYLENATGAGRVASAADAWLWVVVDTGASDAEQSPFGACFRDVLPILRGHPELFEESSWTGALSGTATVRLFRRIGSPAAVKALAS